MGAARTHDTANASPALGIRQLSDAFALLAAGFSYSILLDDAGVRLLLVALTLRESLQRRVACVLLLAGEPRTFLRRAKLSGVDLSPWVSSGDLQIFVKLTGSERGQELDDVEGLIADLMDRQISHSTLIVIERGEFEFCLPEPDAVARACALYGDWLARTGHVLLSFFTLDKSQPKVRLALQRLLEQSGGVARIHTSGPALNLEFLHWCGAQGVARPTMFSLSLDRLGATAEPVAIATIAGSRAKVSRPIVATSQAVESLGGAAGKLARLCVVNSIQEALFVSRIESDALLLLHFCASRWEELLLAVVTMHAWPCPRIRLVICEGHDVLRTHQLSLLLKLGVASIVPRGLTADGARILIASLAESVAPASQTPEALRLPRLPEPAVTRLSLAAFRRAIDDFLDTARLLDLPQTLIVIADASDETVSAFMQPDLQRLRDVCICQTDTATAIYFFGCTLSGARAACARMAPEMVLDELTVLISDGESEIRRQLAQLYEGVSRNAGAPLRLVKEATPVVALGSTPSIVSRH